MANSSDAAVSFCETPLWDRNLLINNTHPAFTECFQQTVLTFVPCGWLWLTSVVHVNYVLSHTSRVSVPDSVINISKIVMCVLLAALCVAQGTLQARDRQRDSNPVPAALYLATALQAATFLYAAVLTKISRKALIVSPCVLFIFWSLATVTNVVPFYTTIMDKGLVASDRLFVLRCVTFATLCVQLVLNCWGESSLRHCHCLESDKFQPPSPEVYASFPSKITFHWMNSLIYRGFRHSLTLSDLWDLPSQYKGHVVIPRLQRKLDRYARADVTASRHQTPPPPQKQQQQQQRPPSEAKWDRINATNIQLQSGKTPVLHDSSESWRASQTDSTCRKEQARKDVPLFTCLVRAFYFELLTSNLIRLVGDCVQFANPMLLNALIMYIENKDRYRPWHGYLLVCGFFVVTFIVSVCQNQNFYHANNTGMKIKTALVATVYRKALKMNNETRRQFTTGSIVNFMAIDCQKLQTVSAQLWVLLSAPVQISLAFYFLNDKLGASFLVGVGVIAIMVPVNIRVSVAARKYQAQQLVLKDQRLKMINEILSGIKVIKLNAWEESFRGRVTDTRDAEVRCLKRAAVLNTITVFNWICSPILVTVGTLLAYAHVSEKQYLDPATAFVALSLFNVLKQPMNQLPNCISEIVQGHVSMKRLRKFLSCDELKPSDVSRSTEDGVAVSVKNGTFTWDSSLPPTLSRINIDVKEGQLVAVVGPVGAGKSSLLSAFLGEMKKLKGTASLRGSIAYVPQQAWIQNRYLKDCVIFNNPLDEKRYRKIVRACALKPDIEMFPAGDATEIGEKGVNLSGGQKLRVTLARAVYHDADIYLLDDPLSAVDSHVGTHIFRKVISASGLLKDKTRVMVTHGIHWLPMCDTIVVMDQGHIIQTGTYEQVLQCDGPFAQYLKTHLRRETEDFDPETENIFEQMAVRVENITSDGMTSADEDECRLERKYSRLKERASEVSGKDKDPEEKGQGQGRQLVQEERSQTGRVKGFVIKELLRAFGLGAAAVALLLVFFYHAMSISANIWLSRWTDDSFLRNVSQAGRAEYRERTAMYVGVYAGLGILQATLTFLFVGTIAVNMISASRQLHSSMLNTILHQPMIFFDTTPLGRILNRFSRDVDAVDGSMARLVRMFAIQVFTVLSVLVVITYSTPIFLAAALPMMVVYYFVQLPDTNLFRQKLYIPCSRQLRRHESVSRSPIYSHFSETINGAASIRAFGVCERFQSESQSLVDQNNVFYYAFISASRWLRIRLELMGNLIVVSAALFAATSQDLTGSLVGLSVSYALQVTGALNMLVQNSTQLESNIVSVERMVEYITLPQEPPWVIENKRPDPTWPTKGEVGFVNYSTCYRPGLDLVLHSISCTVHSGEKVGIVGRTGAGKSSLSLSLFRLLEAAEGSIVIDGVTVANIGLHDLRSRLTILPQDPVLFSGTLRFNLDPLSKYTDTEVWSALEQANLKDFVDSQPAGLLFDVDEGGLNLSAGQRQLVCLARALLRRTRVLILDEATAAVDFKTDVLIQNSLRTAFRHCTVLTIAHRLNTVMDYDKIVVLENGRVVEMDAPDNLLKDQATIFHRMAQEAQLIP